MRKISIPQFANSMKSLMIKHSPEILTGIGIAGMISTTIMAVKATPKALWLLNEEENRKERDLTKIEQIKAGWKPYIPAAITGTISVACLVGASSINFRRNTVLAAAYSLSETALLEYKDAVVETVGEKKEQVIQDKIAKRQIEKNPINSKEIVFTDKGNTICYDVVSGRYFKTDIDELKKSVNRLNHNLMSEMYISLNEFYYAIGIGGIGIGDDLGWNIDNGLIELSYSSQLAEDDTPCLVINYNVAPRYDYRNLK